MDFKPTAGEIGNLWRYIIGIRPIYQAITILMSCIFKNKLLDKRRGLCLK
jgi:hypothetical protein